ncbi:MAG: DUF1573 domain-containing protein [Cyclobacteriaceae bacterium]|nr:DUF1573 domain-containing protein [Cyclobacteriaceae bacterium]
MKTNWNEAISILSIFSLVWLFACSSGEGKKDVVQHQSIDSNIQGPAIRFEQEVFDFGTVKEGDVVEHTFVFTNVGSLPLLIENALASCGCTVPEWSSEPIQPGKSGSIKVRFNTNNRPNQQLKTVTVRANTDPAETRLRIKGVVTPKNV